MPANIGFNTTLSSYRTGAAPPWQVPQVLSAPRLQAPPGGGAGHRPGGAEARTDAGLSTSVNGSALWGGTIFDLPGAWQAGPDRTRRFVVGGRSPTRDEMPHAAELALRDFGDELWKVKLAGRRFGIARDIRIASVKALGGRDSDLGRAFIQRCRNISRFTWRLARIEGNLLSQAVRDNPQQYAFVIAGIVREEVEKFRRKVLSRLLCGCDFSDAATDRLKDTIDCRIRMERRNLFLPFKWLASKIWC